MTTTISKQLVNLMGGEIKAKSPSGLSDNPKYPGAEFIFTLRFRTNKHTKLLNLSKITNPTDIKALIITDDRLQVQAITKNLASLHIENKYHIIIIDNRPDFNGLEFLNELHNHKLHSKFLIIVQSADFEQTNTSIAKQLGADTYLRKPVKLIVLKEFISQHFPGIDTSDLATQTVLEKNLKVLVAEDNKLNQRVIQNLFKRFSITVDIADNGAIAVKMAKEKEYDMIFMDIFMPEMDGVSAVKELKTLKKKTMQWKPGWMTIS